MDNLIVPAAKSRTPLPANPDGVARLQALTQAAAGQPQVTPQPVPPPPAIAEQVLGEMYILEKNELDLESFSLVRQEGAEALLRLSWGENLAFAQAEYRIGLDGVPSLRTGEFSMPAAGKGKWEGENVFIVEIDEIGNLLNWRLELEFKDDEVTATITDDIDLTDTFVVQGKRAG